MAAPKPPVYSDFFGGKTPPNHSLSNVAYFLSLPDFYKTTLDQITGAVGSIDNYIKGKQAYEAAYQDYLLQHAKYVVKTDYGRELSQDRVDFYNQQKEDVVNKVAQEAEAAKSVLRYQVTPEMQKQANQDPYYAAQIGNPDLLKLLIDNPDEAYKLRLDDRSNRINKIRSELENQYNNLVAADSRFGYTGRNSDLPTIFNQQAAQLADAGVISIADLRIKDGQLYDTLNRKVVTNSNLGGQVYTDRDTGVQKWGDIFSDVRGGANYGIIQAPDESVLLFPAWERTKSPISQVGLGGLESFITPLLTVGGAFIGAGPAGSVAGAALGAGAGSTVGQLLASGEVDWEKVALSAGGAAAGQAIFGPGAAGAGEAGGSGISAGAGGETGLLAGSGGVTGITPPAGFELAPNLGAGAGAGLLSPSEIDLVGGVDFTKIGETGISGVPTTGADLSLPIGTAAPGVGEGIMVLPPSIPGGAATVAGLETPSLGSMGGGQGLTVPVQGGTVFEGGFVPAGATPSLGDPSSFINNPDYLGSPVISEDYLGLTASDMPSTVNIQDALRMARTGMQLFGPQQQQLLGMGGYGGGDGQAAGVDSSGLLALLQGRAGVPGVSPLLAPVVNPYQPLLGTTTQSLLG